MMDLLNNIFKYVSGLMPQEKREEFFNNIASSERARRNFKDIFNFKVERNMLRASISRRELDESLKKLHLKLSIGHNSNPAGRRYVPTLAVVSILFILTVSIISLRSHIQQVEQAKTMEYLATVEIPDMPNDVNLTLSSGEKIHLGNERQELDKSDVKIVAEGNSVKVSNGGTLGREAVERTLSDSMTSETVGKKLNCLEVNSKEDFLLLLEDGSKVWMRQNSKISFPDRFSGSSRVIEFEGEGYFSIAPDEKMPFIVKTKDIQAKVLGTEFNLKSERDGDIVKVNMISGKLSVENGEENDILLVKNHQLILDTSTDKHSLAIVDNFKYQAWKEGYFYFENEILKNILPVLENMYEIDIVLKTDKYDDELFNGKMKRSNGLDKIMSALEESFDFKFHMEDEILYFY